MTARPADQAANDAGDEVSALPALIDRAARTLADARYAAEILDARDMASLAYDMAKKAARFAEAKCAHDELIAKIHRAQAHALEIEAGAAVGSLAQFAPERFDTGSL